MKWVVGDPPRWLMLAQRTPKYLFRAAVVGQWLWVEIAIWRTKKGAQRGSVVEPGAIRIVTPTVGIALNCYFTPKAGHNGGTTDVEQGYPTVLPLREKDAGPGEPQLLHGDAWRGSYHKRRYLRDPSDGHRGRCHVYSLPTEER